MSLGLIKPGMAALYHPKTGQAIEPIGFLKNGTAVWPILGASSDDVDDPAFTGEDDDTDEDDDEEDEDPKGRGKRPAKKPKSKSDDEDDDDSDDEDEDPKPTRPERQAARYRVRAKEALERAEKAEARLKALEDKEKPTDEVVSRDLTEARTQVENLTEVNLVMSAQLAFFKSNKVEWIDASDAFALAEREGLFDDLIDEDGTVDARELQRGLRDLAKRKPHLVKTKPVTKTSGPADDDNEDEDDEEPRSRRSAPGMNGRRKGKGQVPSRDDLAKKFPVLGRR